MKRKQRDPGIVRIGGVLLVAAVLRLLTMGRPIHFDEAVHIYIASHPLGVLFSLVFKGLGGGQPHLFLLMLRALLAISSNIIWLRAVMLCFDLAGLYVIYAVARRIFNDAVALYAVAMLACAEPYIFHSTQIRVYSLWIFLSMLSVYCFVRLLTAPSVRWYAGWAMTTVAAMYAHLFAILMLMVEIVVWVVVFRRLRLRPIVFFLSGACMVIALVPLKWFLDGRCLAYPYVWEYYYYALPKWTDVYVLFRYYCGHPVFLACAAVFIAAGIFSRARTGFKGITPLSAALKLFAVSGLVLPIAAIYFLHPWGMSFFRETRYLLPALVFFFMLLAWIIIYLPQPMKRWVVPVFLSLLLLNGLQYSFKVGRGPPDTLPVKAIAAYLGAHRQAGDQIAVRNIYFLMQLFNELRLPYAILTSAEEINRYPVLKLYAFDPEKLYVGMSQLQGLKRLWCVQMRSDQPLPWFEREQRIVLKERVTLGNAEIRLYAINP